MNKRIILAIVSMLAFVSQISAEEKITVKDFSISAGETKAVSIELENEAVYAGFQFDMYLPDGITIKEYSANKDRVPESTSLEMTTQEDGSYRFIAAAMGLENLKGTSGSIITITISAKEGIADGVLTGYFRNVKLSTLEGTGTKYAEIPFSITVLAPSTVTAKSYERFYGDDNPDFAFDVEGGALDGTPEITCEATVTSSAGTYDIEIKRGTETNFNVTYVKGTLTIKKAPLTITAKSYTIKQGEALPDFEATYEGFKNNETETVLTKKPAFSCSAEVGSKPGTYDIIISGAEADNYSFTYVKGTLTVTDADPVTVTANSYEIVYGDALPEFEYTSTGASLNGVPTITCTATANSPVGTYPITIAKGTVTNYNDTYVNGTLTIKKATLTVTAKSYTIKQGEALPDFEATYEGFKNNETETVLTKKPAFSCSAEVGSKPGTYDITISGAEADNYSFTYVKGTLTVTDADPVTVTANSYEITYGDALPEFEYTSTGAALNGVPTISCTATANSPVGTYPITIAKGSVTNYNDSYVNGILTIKKAPLTIKAGEYTKEQGEDNPEFTLTYEGFKNDETEEVLTKKPSVSTLATKESEPGDYDVTVSGAEAQNYDITYVNGKLTITAPEHVTISGDANCDEKVDAQDIVDIVNYMMGKATSTGKFDIKAADLNNDNIVDAADIIILSNMLL